MTPKRKKGYNGGALGAKKWLFPFTQFFRALGNIFKGDSEDESVEEIDKGYLRIYKFENGDGEFRIAPISVRDRKALRKFYRRRGIGRRAAKLLRKFWKEFIQTPESTGGFKA